MLPRFKSQKIKFRKSGKLVLQSLSLCMIGTVLVIFNSLENAIVDELVEIHHFSADISVKQPHNN